MFDSNVFDVTFGVVFVFLVLSAATSWFTELMVQFLKLRSHHLKQYLTEWIDTGGDISFVDKLYNSKVISALYKKKGWRAGPTYIGARDFVTGVIEIALTTEEGMVTKETEELADLLNKNLPDSLSHPIIAFMQKISEPVKGLEQEAISVRKSLEEWFDAAMDRCVDFYKRKVYWIGLAGAFLIACVTNMDTVAITRALWENQDTRLSIAAMATDYIDVLSQPGLRDFGEEEKAADIIRNIDMTLREMQGLGLPLFWDTSEWNMNQPELANDIYNQNLGHVFSHWSLVLSKFLGISATALAASFGSSIWFDLLKQLVNLRSVGPKPEEKKKTSG